MSTWHQRQNMPQLWHATLGTLVTDPPEETLTVERFKDAVEAQRRCDNLKEAFVRRTLASIGHDQPGPALMSQVQPTHIYLIPPQP